MSLPLFVTDCSNKINNKSICEEKEKVSSELRKANWNSVSGYSFTNWRCGGMSAAFSFNELSFWFFVSENIRYYSHHRLFPNLFLYNILDSSTMNSPSPVFFGHIEDWPSLLNNILWFHRWDCLPLAAITQPVQYNFLIFSQNSTLIQTMMLTEFEMLL